MVVWLCDTSLHTCDLKKQVLKPDSQREMKYLNRALRRWLQGLDWVCDPKHARTVFRGYGMTGCNGKETPMANASVGESCLGEALVGE